MKFVVTLVAFFSLTAAMASDSVKIKQLTAELCGFSKGCDDYTGLRGTTALALVKNLALTRLEADADVEVVASEDSTPGWDDIVYGTLSLAGAQGIVGGILDYDALTRGEARSINARLKRLQAAGAEFGYTPNTGGSVCGVVVPGLLIIDTGAKTITDVSLFGHGECK